MGVSNQLFWHKLADEVLESEVGNMMGIQQAKEITGVDVVVAGDRTLKKNFCCGVKKEISGRSWDKRKYRYKSYR